MQNRKVESEQARSNKTNIKFSTSFKKKSSKTAKQFKKMHQKHTNNKNQVYPLFFRVVNFCMHFNYVLIRPDYKITICVNKRHNSLYTQRTHRLNTVSRILERLVDKLPLNYCYIFIFY